MLVRNEAHEAGPVLGKGCHLCPPTTLHYWDSSRLLLEMEQGTRTTAFDSLNAGVQPC